PSIMLESCDISSLALFLGYGGSGDGDEPLPMGFRGLLQVYVDDIIFGSTNKDLCKAFEKLMKDKFQMSSMDGKLASTPIDTEKPLLKDPDGKDVDVHTYSDYAGAILDRKSTTGGCQFLYCRLISWQCKKQIVIATSSTKAEYVADQVDAKDGIEVSVVDLKITAVRLIINDVSSKLLLFDASEGFEQIIDFLNASVIRRKLIITEDTVRQALRLDDAESIDCLPNEEIFVELARIGGCIQTGGKIAELDADEDVTLEEVVAEVAKDAEVQGRLEESQAQVYHLDLEHAQKVLITAAATTITAAPSAARRRKGIVIRDPEETATPSVIVHSESKSKDKEKGILVEEPKPLMKQVKRKEKQDNTVLRYQSLKRKPQTEAHVRKNMMVYLKNMVGFKMDFFKGMSYDVIRLIFEKHFNSIVAFLEKGEDELKEEASKAIKRKSKSSKEKAAKTQKLDEEV
nr:ribonuclease H-like domain, reverse transcriptase, RNA-dependent DNA polymerase [Tanacetum cinerariifolium]